MLRWLSLSPLMLVGVLSSGCTVESSDPGPSYVSPTTPDGTLVLSWTIDGLVDPAKCSQSASDSIEIVVNGPSGGVFSQACSAFSTSITLAPGNYTASAALTDAAGNHRTTNVNLNPFTILGADSLRVPLDFPADSFR